MPRAAIILTLAASLAHAEDSLGMERTLMLPGSLASGAGAFLEVQVGPLAPGQQVRVTTPSGSLLGTIAPFGPPARAGGGVYSLPLPAEAVRNGALSVRVMIEDGDKPARAPTDAEVQSLKLQAPFSQRD